MKSPRFLSRLLPKGLQGMHEYKIAFASHSRAAAFVSPDQPVQSFESLAMRPSEQIHIGSQVGRVYRLVLREDSQVFALLMVLLDMPRSLKRGPGRAPKNQGKS